MRYNTLYKLSCKHGMWENIRHKSVRKVTTTAVRLGSETEADSETTKGETTSTEDENQDTEDEDFHCEEMESEFEDDIEKRHRSRKLSLNLGLAVFMLKGLKVIPSFGSLIFFS